MFPSLPTSLGKSVSLIKTQHENSFSTFSQIHLDTWNCLSTFIIVLIGCFLNYTSMATKVVRAVVNLSPGLRSCLYSLFILTPLSTEHLVLTQKSRHTADPSPLGTPPCPGHTPVSLQPAQFSPTSKVLHLECSSVSPRPSHPCVLFVTEIATQWPTLRESPFGSLISLSTYHDILSHYPAFFFPWHLSLLKIVISLYIYTYIFFVGVYIW